MLTAPRAHIFYTCNKLILIDAHITVCTNDIAITYYINKHMNYILHRIHTLRYIYPTSTYSNIGGKMGQAGSKSEGQFIPLWDCTGGTLDRGCSTGNDWNMILNY